MDIGRFIDQMQSIRAEKSYHEGEIKRLNAELALMENTLKTEMLDQGASEIKGTIGKATLHKDVLYPQVEDWASLHSDIRERNLFDLLHKRISLTNYRQLVEANSDPAGVLRNYVTEVTLRSI